MSSQDPQFRAPDPSSDPRNSVERSAASEAAPDPPKRSRAGRGLRIFGFVLLLLVVVAVVAFFTGRSYVHKMMVANLPQIDGSLVAYGLGAPVTVDRDAHGVPHIRANSLDDLVFAQGYITAQDRLFQMELLRHHAAGDLAAILGRNMLEHDRIQRTLQLRAAADRALAALPKDQRHWLDVYARGVNASMIAQRQHLPVEFRLIGYTPLPWTPRDSLLVELAMFQDLTTGFPEKLGREALAAHLSPDLIADLYPVGSWRDHPPGQPIPDLTAPQADIPDVPLDESQSKLRQPATKSGAPGLDSQTWVSHSGITASDLLALKQALSPFHAPCDSCVAGSGSWAVSGAHTASGKPMLSNDMHLSLAVPEVWYEADLEASNPAPLAAFHAAGVTLPGVPFVIAGHNDHVAWGFTNLGADVQDLYIEHTRGTPTGAEYQTAGGLWKPVQYRTEVIHIRGAADVLLDVPITLHNGLPTPIVSSLSSYFPNERRSLSLAWTVYDPANVTAPFFAVDSASDWSSMLSAFSTWGGPAQNLMYADDQGHIGYHAVGRIPIRGDVNNPSPLSPVPVDTAAPGAASHEWVAYIPFDQLPQAFDPPDGVLATANARVTLDGYRYPITLNWSSPYRTERIYKVLDPVPAKDAAGAVAAQPKLAPADMLALQNDVFSELDLVFAQRLAYSIDHTTGPLKSDPALRQAADILRAWNGQVDANAAAPAIVNAARARLWLMLLVPKLAPQLAPQIAQGVDLSKIKNVPPDVAQAADLWRSYEWGERSSVEEELLTHTPPRWLPPGFATWEDFLAAVVQRGLHDAQAPKDLSTWQQGKAYPLDIESPVLSRSPLLRRVIVAPTGTGPRAESGDMTTVKQVGATFGPSERFTADLGDPDRTTLNLVLGQSGDPLGPWYMDQFEDWLNGRTYTLPFTPAAAGATTAHTLTLMPR